MPKTALEKLEDVRARMTSRTREITDNEILFALVDAAIRHERIMDNDDWAALEVRIRVLEEWVIEFTRLTRPTGGP